MLFGNTARERALFVGAVKELPWVQIAITNANRNLLNNFHHMDDTYLQNYLDEVTNRLNRRYFGEKLLERLLIEPTQ